MHDEIEVTRTLFEERAFVQRYIHSIRRNPDPPQPKIAGAMDFVSRGCPTKAEFIKRSGNGHYVDMTLDAMWWAWCEAVQHFTTIAASLEAYREDHISIKP